MKDWTFFCRTRELPPGGYRTQWIEELRDEITVFRRTDGLLARSTVCPHNGGEFDVDMESNELRCRWHGWRFAIDNGACLQTDSEFCLRAYRADEVDGEIRVAR